MSFETFLNQGWDDHITQAQVVWQRLPSGLDLVVQETELGQLAHLAQHVAGEHLGLWGDGQIFLKRLLAHPLFDAKTPSGKTVYRSLAVLSRCQGDHGASEAFEQEAAAGSAAPPASERVRILAQTAAALAGQQQIAAASQTFHQALALAAYGPGVTDPAARALAITGNNLAIELEERPTRTAEEVKLMVLAAETGRQFWQVAGGWTEVERAEYRLAMSWISAGDGQRALHHARQCVSICEDNRAIPYEHFYGWEATARAAYAAKDVYTAKIARDRAKAYIDQMKAEAQPECRATLARLDQHLAS